MSKRKLTRKQAWRIEKIQQEKTQRANRKAEALDDSELQAEQTGRVISHFGSLVEVEADTPAEHAEPLSMQCYFRANVGSLVTGDRVVWRAGKAGLGMIEAVLPRATALNRPDSRGQLKPVAANMDFIVLVITPEPTPSSLLIDRYLVAAELQQIPVYILLNKTDLIHSSNGSDLDALLSMYQDVGYPVLRSSTKTADGLQALRDMLNHKVSAFVGQSGVGKSSLVNALLPGVNIKVGALSERAKLGRHTTTNARLFHFPSGGSLIDSPGIREFGLWHLAPEQIIDGYREFLPLLGHCRFRDCSHRQEPGCALRAAYESGTIHPTRFENYFALLDAVINSAP